MAAPAGPAPLRPPSWLSIIGLFAIALIVYQPALRGGMIWNDSDYVTAPSLRSLHGLFAIWFKLGATQQYYPLLHSAFWIEHRLWGDAPIGYHLVNVLLHATSACLLWHVLKRLAIPGAWLAAVLFVVHPVAAETVAWISEQKNTLSTVFYLAAVACYLRFDAQRQWRDYSGALILFLCAVLSKTVAATLPGALLVILWWRRGRLGWARDIGPLIPWLGLGAAGGLFSGWVERTFIGASGAAFALNAVERVLLAGRAIWFYLGKLVWPAGLNFVYPRWHISAAAPAQYVYPLAALALTGALWRIRGRTRAPLAAWLFFVGSLFPTLGFMNVFAFLFSYVADHWQYLACLGVFTLAAAAGTAAFTRSPPWGRPILLGIAAAALGLLGHLTWTECARYHDVVTFYSAILARNPDAFMAHNNLGIELEHQGRLDAAIAHYQEAIRIERTYADAQCNLGQALCEKGAVPAGIEHFRIALEAEPNNAVVHNDLGVALGRVGQEDEAIAHFETAARINPDYLDPELNLGFAYRRLHRDDASIASYEQALRIQPDNAIAENGLGLTLAEAGRPADAVTHYQRALLDKPGYAEAHCNLGAVYGAEGHLDQAQREFEAAVTADAKLPDAHFDLGLILMYRRQFPEAAAQFEAAVRLRPSYADAEFQWGEALRAQGRLEEAQSHFDTAAQLKLQAGAAAVP